MTFGRKFQRGGLVSGSQAESRLSYSEQEDYSSPRRREEHHREAFQVRDFGLRPANEDSDWQHGRGAYPDRDEESDEGNAEADESGDAADTFGKGRRLLAEYDKAKDFVRARVERRAAKYARERHEGLRRNIPQRVDESIGDLGGDDDEPSLEGSENYDTNQSYWPS